MGGLPGNVSSLSGVWEDDMRHLALLLAATALGGCAATGPRFTMPADTAPAGQARMVVYQTGSQIIPSDYAVLLDGDKSCAMRPGQVMVKDIAPGPHKIAFDNPRTFGTSVLSFDAQAGTTVTISASTNAHTVLANVLVWPVAEYVRADTSTPRGGSVYLEQPSAEVAAKEMANLTSVTCKH